MSLTGEKPIGEQPLRALLGRMSLAEKVGQLCQINGAEGSIPDSLREAIAAGRVGSVINEVNPEVVRELQRIAVEDSRLGIPLLIARDVIHGFNTVFPIPLGQAASWNPQLVKAAAAAAASEATAVGVNWALAPMLDIGRDPRWGRIAETFGEDPLLISALGRAVIAGYQGDELSARSPMAACAKHFAGYGATEAGRDYNTTDIPEIELRNVHFPPFAAAIKAGVGTVMAGFSDLNGVPCTGNAFLMNQILRREWHFDGFVVSDWESVPQLVTHGFATDNADAAEKALTAGLDMEMAGSAYSDHLIALIETGRMSEQLLDRAVLRVLRIKQRMGLLAQRADKGTPRATREIGEANSARERTRELARQLARESIVMLTNRNNCLPIAAEALRSLAVIGPLADDPQEQLGTWVFDGDPNISETPVMALRDAVNDQCELRVVRGIPTTRSKSVDGFPDAIAAAAGADVALLFLGEEAILSGEAHCRADITLPGKQRELIEAVTATGTPTVLIVQAGRPLALADVIDKPDATLYTWHAGTMAGPALTDLLFGKESPSGKLPVTLPRATGQIPIYYAHKNTGRPGKPDCPINIDTISDHDQWDSAGFTSFHLDTGCTPLFCFGYGLSYTEFRYDRIKVPEQPVSLGKAFKVAVRLTNAGSFEAEEITQLYIRDRVASATRPVRELKAFRRTRLQPGQQVTLEFRLHTDDLAFFGTDMCERVEPGDFQVWVGGSSDAELTAGFSLVA